MSEPIAGADLWRPVMEAAGWRCWCTGQCGAPHRKDEGRCPRTHDNYASKQGGWVRLIAAPADPTTRPLDAARLGPADLRAWCPACHTAATRAARKTRASGPPQGDGLFDL
ncbi:hypothetical protein SAZ_25300 [Streptomyces noursei ZPM]|uniref:HNH endonuclease n=1 Tax=Streptomyces noursei TaxID=1971 RepID=A0A401R5G6_STRNR|nr:hypothetical protein [Streptomyces noursei]AKA05398.1 hypothetical protein SAZ_25300 [Streptomyces noursei ZPM]EOT04325.1 hypothetical protein K530_09218 [Streptomyces noursei CCRC 11814]EXU86843.1 hypothetical protein P354_39980 [Streptomyces noursei PD-1]UWS73796.1 hypothetical protein N1H47_22625 [Streptomyces noursei]GCB92881.1 hypothetical protein SALB_05656 [Streptomyces noursei]